MYVILALQARTAVRWTVRWTSASLTGGPAGRHGGKAHREGRLRLRLPERLRSFRHETCGPGASACEPSGSCAPIVCEQTLQGPFVFATGRLFEELSCSRFDDERAPTGRGPCHLQRHGRGCSCVLRRRVDPRCRRWRYRLRRRAQCPPNGPRLRARRRGGHQHRGPDVPQALLLRTRCADRTACRRHRACPCCHQGARRNPSNSRARYPHHRTH